MNFVLYFLLINFLVIFYFSLLNFIHKPYNICYKQSGLYRNRKQNKKGLPSIKYIKNISKGITYYVEEVLNDKNILESKTIYRKRTEGDTTNKGGNY